VADAGSADLRKASKSAPLSWRCRAQRTVAAALLAIWAGVPP
jgi:hypothetical protein